ncbi:LysR family transcriptional regulator [Pseudoalteromonas sp. T1lg23B]|uniref:LysR family transcriptional regulator n=1 Tax=Pseudoalteromonas sp. T1lg23B TaxID=2077097 RepID=UPI0018FEE714|nr:LysR family transcriptional regulator [Pseudoalteromonas sp. T1lg23B]
MNWDDFRYFLALARQGSVSGAGRELNVKHTTVARRIAALEKSLGSQLFDRTPHGYVLTQVGENLVPHVNELEAVVFNADREVFGMDSRLSGILRVASSYDLFSRLITPYLHEFSGIYPDIILELVSSTSLIDLGSREADIAVRISPKPPENLIGTDVVQLGHGVYASETYLLSHHKRQKLILWLNETTRPEWAEQHFPDGDIVARASDVISMMELAKNHMGIARLPCYVGDSEPTLRRIDLPLTPSNWKVWVLSHKDLRDTARVRAARAFFIEKLKAQRHLIEGSASNFMKLDLQ